MKSLKDYRKYIEGQVRQISDKDPMWDFEVKSVSDYRVEIRWTYLSNLREMNDSFSLTTSVSIDNSEEMFLVARNPQDKMIEGYFVTESEPDFLQVSWESGIRQAIEEIADYAHYRY